jgi:hypothetical protein
MHTPPPSSTVNQPTLYLCSEREHDNHTGFDTADTRPRALRLLMLRLTDTVGTRQLTQPTSSIYRCGTLLRCGRPTGPPKSESSPPKPCQNRGRPYGVVTWCCNMVWDPSCDGPKLPLAATSLRRYTYDSTTGSRATRATRGEKVIDCASALSQGSALKRPESFDLLGWWYENSRLHTGIQVQTYTHSCARAPCTFL